MVKNRVINEQSVKNSNAGYQMKFNERKSVDEVCRPISTLSKNSN